MTTNVINKGWFNPISFSVLLVLIFVSVVLYAMEIVNTQIFLLLDHFCRIVGFFNPYCRSVGAGGSVAAWVNSKD